MIHVLIFIMGAVSAILSLAFMDRVRVDTGEIRHRYLVVHDKFRLDVECVTKDSGSIEQHEGYFCEGTDTGCVTREKILGNMEIARNCLLSQEDTTPDKNAFIERY